MSLSGKRIWIIGASSGLGAALARALSAEGASLLLSARSEEPLQELAGELAEAQVIPFDVTDAAATAKAAKAAGAPDVLVYCAGFYEPVEATDWQSEAVVKMADTNFTGALRVLGAALPAMLARGSGQITLIGSLSGFRGLPGAVGYGASKAGLMHLAENLRADLKGTGLTVQRVNPGFIATRLTEKNEFDMPQIMSPEAAAERVVVAMKSGRFSTSFPAPFAWLFTAGRALPLGLWQRIFG